MSATETKSGKGKRGKGKAAGVFPAVPPELRGMLGTMRAILTVNNAAVVAGRIYAARVTAGHTFPLPLADLGEVVKEAIRLVATVEEKCYGEFGGGGVAIDTTKPAGGVSPPDAPPGEPVKPAG